MEHLIREVAEETRLQQYRTIEAYMRENKDLQEELEAHETKWRQTIILVEAIIQFITAIQKLEKAAKESFDAADTKWLAFWGIYREASGSHPLWF
jgi:hypothetical protein